MSPRNGNEADVPVITSESDDNTFRLLQMAAGGRAIATGERAHGMCKTHFERFFENGVQCIKPLIHT